MNRRDAMKLTAVSSAVALLTTGAGGARELGTSASPEYIEAADGAHLFVRDWGTGKPVLFISGWALPSDFWCYQMLALAQNGSRAIAYDRRGHGRSFDPGRGYDHDTLADDLARIISELGLEDVTVVAHSMGATEVARYFSRHDGRGISRIVLVGAITPFLMKSADNSLGIDRALLAGLRAPLAVDFPAWIDANAAPFFVPETSPDLVSWGKGLMLQTSLLAATELARANAETDFRPDVRSIDVPTLLIHGDRDASAPLALTAQATEALIAGSSLKVYEGAPHGLPLTHVQRLNEDLLAFMGAD